MGGAAPTGTRTAIGGGGATAGRIGTGGGTAGRSPASGISIGSGSPSCGCSPLCGWASSSMKLVLSSGTLSRLFSTQRAASPLSGLLVL